MLKLPKFLYIASCLTLSYPALAQIETRDGEVSESLFPWQSSKEWAPLSQTEIDDAHSCTVDAFLAVCAGDKIIATGIMINNTIGTSLIGPVDKRFGNPNDNNLNAEIMFPQRFTTPINLSLMVFSVDALVTLQQPANNKLGAAAWSRAYYVMSDKQLINIIEMARRDPMWNPVK